MRSLSLVVKPGSHAAVASKTKLLAWLLLGFASIVLAEKAAQLSDDFLEYLGNMEDNDDNWSDFNHEVDADANTSVGSAHQSSSASSSQSSRRSVDHASPDGNSR